MDPRGVDSMEETAPFIDKRLRVGWDSRFGYGVFAVESIPKDQFIEMAPVILLDSMPEDNLSKYVFAWRDGRLAISLGWTMLYNHSDNNCCEFSINTQHKLLAIITLKNIEVGQQLTVNYGPDWFSSRNMEKSIL